MPPKTEWYTKTDWAELFFSSTGRLRNSPFIIASVVLLISAGLFQSAIEGPAQYILGWIVYPVLFFSGACVLSKRLHDRGRSGWWSAVILLAVMMVWPSPMGFFDFVAALVIFWALVELSVMPGERGNNRYGFAP